MAYIFHKRISSFLVLTALSITIGACNPNPFNNSNDSTVEGNVTSNELSSPESSPPILATKTPVEPAMTSTLISGAPSPEITTIVSPTHETSEGSSAEVTATAVPASEIVNISATFEDLPELKVVYFDSGQIKLWTPHSEVVSILDVENVETVLFSGDGSIIAYTLMSGENGEELWVIDADGSNPRKLLSASDLAALRQEPNAIAITPYNLTWVPGTHDLAFNTFPVFEGIAVYNPDDLWRVNADTGAVSPILTSGQGGEFTFSPDGEFLSVVTPVKFSLMRSDGSERQDNLLTYASIPFGEYYFLPQPIWAPDSRSLALAIPSTGDPYSQSEAQIAVWIVSVEEMKAVRSAEFTAFPPSIVFSPDLSKLAYWRTEDPNSPLRELHIANVDGAEDERYHVSERLDFVSWVPDSERFVFWHDPFSFIPMLGQLGRDPVPLTDLPTVITMRWIDNIHFIFVRKEGKWPQQLRGDGPWQLYLGVPGGSSLAIAISLTGSVPAFDFWPDLFN